MLCAPSQNGRKVSTWSASGHFAVIENIYTDSGPIAFRNGSTNFEHLNWIGTERLRTTYTGSTETSFTSLPWGDDLMPNGDNGDQYDFASLDRDLEDNTEHAQFRNYSVNQGRWLTPDPYLGSYDFTNPQSFNRYSYALNNPVSFIDPSGLGCQDGRVTDGDDDDGTCGGGQDGGGGGDGDSGQNGSSDGTGSDGVPTQGPGSEGDPFTLVGPGITNYTFPSLTAIYNIFSFLPGYGSSGYFGSGGGGGSAPNKGNSNPTYPLLNTRNQTCGADANAALKAETGKIVSGDWVGTTAAGVVVRAVTIGGVTVSGVAQGAAISFAGRALYYGGKGLLNGATTGAACAISSGVTSLFDSLTGQDY